MSVFKVYYQENANEIPVRENTLSLYIEAETAVDVMKYLEPRKYNIELITELSPEHLEYEMKSENFVLEKING